MKNILVYRHRTLDTHEVFYIGIGSLKRSKTKHNRSSYWNNIVNKHGYYIEIIQEGLNWEEACELEELLILEYGRRDLNTGCLVNLTNGGEGSPGVITSEKTKYKLHLKNIGKKLTSEHKNKIGLANKGKVPTDKVRKRQLEVVCKKVINTDTGVVYKSAKEVSRIFNIEYSKLNRCLNGKVKSKSKIKFKYY